MESEEITDETKYRITAKGLYSLGDQVTPEKWRDHMQAREKDIEYFSQGLESSNQVIEFLVTLIKDASDRRDWTNLENIDNLIEFTNGDNNDI